MRVDSRFQDRVVTTAGELHLPDVGRAVILGSLAGLILFAALALAVNARLLANVDLNATIALQPYHRPLLDRVSVATAFLLSAEMCGLYGIILSAALWRAGAGRWAVLPLGFVGPVAVEALLKYVLHQPLVPLAYYHDVPLPLLNLSTPGSFPSGHTVRAAWFVVFVGALYRPGSRWVRRAELIFLEVLIAFICATRVYLGVHWLSDSVGGALFGAAAALPFAALAARRFEGREPEG